MKKCILITIVLRVFICTSFAQTTLGTPAIKNYAHSEYNAGNEIWDVKQDKNGILYFANDEGLLTFDGSYWKTYPLPNKSAIKSVAIDPKGRIYVGDRMKLATFPQTIRVFLSIIRLNNCFPVKPGNLPTSGILLSIMTKFSFAP